MCIRDRIKTCDRSPAIHGELTSKSASRRLGPEGHHLRDWPIREGRARVTRDRYRHLQAAVARNSLTLTGQLKCGGSRGELTSSPCDRASVAAAAAAVAPAAAVKECTSTSTSTSTS